MNDNFDLRTSYVMPALIRKFHEAKISRAKEVVICGTGKPMREFLYVDDLAEACIYMMNEYSGESHMNIGIEEDISIEGLAMMIKNIVGYKGKITQDSAKSDATPRKLLDVSLLYSIGWKHSMALRVGIERTYKWDLNQNM